jgi:hypothetical protein
VIKDRVLKREFDFKGRKEQVTGENCRQNLQNMYSSQKTFRIIESMRKR